MTQSPPEVISSTPALPLDYFDRQNGPWVPIVRMAAWVAIAYSALVIASELVSLVMFTWQSVTPNSPSNPRFNTTSSILLNLPPAATACVLLVGGFMSLQLQRAGRLMVLVSAALVAAFSILTFLINLVMMLTGSLYPRSFGTIFVVYQVTSIFFTMLYHVFVPAMLCLLFLKREVRDVFGTQL